MYNETEGLVNIAVRRKAMNKEEIVAIAVRLFAVALGVNVLNSMPGMFMYFNDEVFREAAYLFSGSLTLIVLISILLWMFPLTVAKKIIPKSGTDAKIENWSYEGILACGFIVMGVCFLYFVISDSVYWFSVWKFSVSFEGVQRELTPDQIAGIYATVAEFVISVFLILGSRGISNMLLSLRYAGTDPSKNV